MASTKPESNSPRFNQSPFPSPSRHATPPRQTSLPASPGRQRAISFSEDGLPNRSSISTSITDSFHHEPTDSSSTMNAAVRGQNHDRNERRITKSSSPERPSSSPSTSDSSENLKGPWYRKLAANYRSVSLENKGSVARDHLALERTFLAWLRTSLAFASIGIAITQLFRLNTSFADRKQQQEQRKRDQDPYHSHLNRRDQPAGSLPLSPLMGASLTPEIYSHIQSILDQQSYPITTARENSASTLLDQLLQSRPTVFDSHSAARLRHLGKPLGATFLGISIVILFIGFHRYFESQHWIIRGQFPASRGSVALTGLIAVMLIVASLVIVLVVAPAGSHS